MRPVGNYVWRTPDIWDAKAVVVRTEPRWCESCGGSDLESLWNCRYEARTRAGVFWFDVSNVTCAGCGFVFVSLVYNEAELGNHDRVSYGEFPGGMSDYNVGKRLDFIKECDWVWIARGGSRREQGR